MQRKVAGDDRVDNGVARLSLEKALEVMSLVLTVPVLPVRPVDEILEVVVMTLDQNIGASLALGSKEEC